MKRSSVVAATVFDLECCKMNRKTSKNTVLIKPIFTNKIVYRLFVKCLLNKNETTLCTEAAAVAAAPY